MNKRLFKIFTGQQWAVFCAEQSFGGSADDLRDGFVHLSNKDQLQATLDKYFANIGPVVVAEFAPAMLEDPKLKWEKSRGGQLFPHYYGALDYGLVVQHWHLKDHIFKEE